MKHLTQDLRLIEEYGALLSSKKLEYIELHYFDDLSLSEIADRFNVSRAAVQDAIKIGMKELYELEDKLHYLAKQDKRIKFIKENIKDSAIIKEYMNLEVGDK